MGKDAEILPPQSPSFCCRDPEPNVKALTSYLKQQKEWVTLGRQGKPALEGYLREVCSKESFSGSVVVDANDPWIDELIELLPAGPERLFLYADMSALVEFYAGLSGTAKVRVCFALGTPDETEHVLEGNRDHWMACCYAGSKTEWSCDELRARQARGLESLPGDLLLATRDDLTGKVLEFDSTNFPARADGASQRLVMRIRMER
ncbi:MAG: DUF1826 domain-containing protein [Myxococcota bacterium]